MEGLISAALVTIFSVTAVLFGAAMIAYIVSMFLEINRTRRRLDDDKADKAYSIGQTLLILAGIGLGAFVATCFTLVHL